LAGVFNALGVGFQMVAVEHIPVTQVIAIKRMSALLSVLMGHFIFGEKGLRERLLGAVIMVSGVVMINLA
jgi:drug/metabolite transporter (DMT)-like permease